MLNSRDIDRLRPDVAENCRALLAHSRAVGLPVLVTGTVRDDEYQMQCYKKGTGGKPPATFHSVKAGLAFDICKNVKGQEYADAGFFARVGAIGEAMGFTWGGRWKSVDKPHFQWDAGGQYSGRDIVAGRLPPPMPAYKQKGELDMTKDEVRAMVREEVRGLDTVYRKAEDVPAWAEPTVRKLMAQGAINGTGEGLDLTYTQLRLLVINDRMGLYGGVN